MQTAANEGIEASYNGVLAGIDLRASLTLQDPVEQDRTSLPPQQALRRAKTLAAFAATELRRLSPGPEWRSSGERRDQSINDSTDTVSSRRTRC